MALQRMGMGLVVTKRMITTVRPSENVRHCGAIPKAYVCELTNLVPPLLSRPCEFRTVLGVSETLYTTSDWIHLWLDF